MNNIDGKNLKDNSKNRFLNIKINERNGKNYEKSCCLY